MKSNIYTRGGDAGDTSLVGGQRIAKNDIRLEAYGTVDELSSQLGTIAADHHVPDEIRAQIRIIQNKLFNIGAYLATLPEPGTEPLVSGLTPDNIAKLEGWIDAIDEQLPPIRAFILPGGTPEAARTHVARTICRRAERIIIALAKQSYVAPDLIRYINRLSDYLFIAARYINFILGVEETVWDQKA